MTKIITLSLLGLVLFFTGCDKQTKNEAAEASSTVNNSIKEKATEAVDAKKDTASNTADVAKDAMAR